MTALSDLFVAVKERTLSKEKLGEYRDALSSLCAEMYLEMSEIEKAEALFFDSSREKTDVATKRKWDITERGQRKIELKNQIRATEKILSSLKSRLYELY